MRPIFKFGQNKNVVNIAGVFIVGALRTQSRVYFLLSLVDVK